MSQAAMTKERAALLSSLNSQRDHVLETLEGLGRGVESTRVRSW